MSILRLEHVATRLGPGPGSVEPTVVVRLTLQDEAAFSQAAERLSALCARWFRPAPDTTADPAVKAARFLARWAQRLMNQLEGRIVEADGQEDGDGALILLGFHHPTASLQALALAAKLLEESAQLNREGLDRTLADFQQRILPAHPDFQAAILIEHARRHSIPWSRVQGPRRVWRYGWGVRGRMMFESMPMGDSAIGDLLSRNKEASKRVFEDLGAPVAASMAVRSEQELPKAAEAAGYPCVVKPLDRGRSVGVTAYVRNPEQLRAAFRTAAKETRTGVMVERHVEGELIRIIVLRGKFWKAIRRNRPTVLGDGKSTVRGLLQDLNRGRRERAAEGVPIGEVPGDEGLAEALREQGLTPEDVPAPGRRVRLRNIPLLAAGADYDDVTEILHPETRRMAESLAAHFGIQACGLDLMTEDPSRSCHELGAFLEINTTPGLRVPIVAGVPEDELGRAVLGEEAGRVPCLLVIAPAEKQAALREAMPDEPGFGWACGSLAGFGRVTLSGRRTLTHQSAEVLMRNPSTRAFAAVANPEEILRHGLPADRFDLALVMKGASLPEAWMRTLAANCGAVRTDASPEDVGAACREIGRA